MKSLAFALALALCANATLKGRFLTLSDVHPDEHYRINSSITGSCHAGSPSSPSDRAGKYGAPVSDCDAPLTLVDLLFEEFDREWKGKLDFVIVMGDLARHDIDPNLPRTLDEIVSLNRNISDRLKATFEDIPIIPSIGNNDVFPHNIMQAGPTHMLSALQNLWTDYIPEEQYHTFARGGYYSVEVIPNKLVVVALNTLLFFDSNKLMGGCPVAKKHRPQDPGSEHLDWLQVQLTQWRARKLQVFLSGHVPPSDYWPNCYLRFAEIVLAFQDTIIGSVFGHKNVDHFTLFSHSNLFSPLTPERQYAHRIKNLHTTALVDDLRSIYSAVPRDAPESDYAVMNYAPSVIPTFLPAYRIWTYNTSAPSQFYQLSDSLTVDEAEYEAETESSFSLIVQSVRTRLSFLSTVDANRKHKKKRRKHKKKPKHKLPRYTSPDAPSRTNRFLSLLGYEQYFLDLEKANHMSEESTPTFDLEYVTYTRNKLAQNFVDSNNSSLTPSFANVGEAEAFLKAHPRELTPYEMPDLTLGSYLRLAHRLGKEESLWKGFKRRIFVSSGV